MDEAALRDLLRKKWPGMTMPFAVAPAKAGFTLEKQHEGSFAIVRLAAP